MPMKPDVVVWRALLGGCRLHKNVKMAETVITEIEATCSGDHVLLSNLYAAAGRWNGVEDVRRTMRSKGIEKIPGCSSVEMDGSIHEFISGDKSHPSYDDIHAKLIEIGGRMQQQGYVRETAEVFYDVEDEEKEQALGHHSEKLAIAFGLIGGPPDATIRIVKNLRFCMDCHKFAKLVSKIYHREIVVRDRARFHHFRGGTCSCNEKLEVRRKEILGRIRCMVPIFFLNPYLRIYSFDDRM